MGSIENAERREHIRARLDRDIEVCVLPGEETQTDISLVPCRGRDISGGGVSFYAESRYQEESLLRLRIPLGNELLDSEAGPKESLKVLGKVVWCKKNGKIKSYVVGVQFLNIYEEDYRLLNNFCSGIAERRVASSLID